MRRKGTPQAQAPRRHEPRVLHACAALRRIRPARAAPARHDTSRRGGDQREATSGRRRGDVSSRSARVVPHGRAYGMRPRRTAALASGSNVTPFDRAQAGVPVHEGPDGDSGASAVVFTAPPRHRCRVGAPPACAVRSGAGGGCAQRLQVVRRAGARAQPPRTPKCGTERSQGAPRTARRALRQARGQARDGGARATARVLQRAAAHKARAAARALACACRGAAEPARRCANARGERALCRASYYTDRTGALPRRGPPALLKLRALRGLLRTRHGGRGCRGRRLQKAPRGGAADARKRRRRRKGASRHLAQPRCC